MVLMPLAKLYGCLQFSLLPKHHPSHQGWRRTTMAMEPRGGGEANGHCSTSCSGQVAPCVSCHVLRTLQGQHRDPSQGTPMPEALPFPSPYCLTQGEQRSSGCSCSTTSTGSCPVWQAGAGHRPAQEQTVPTLWSPTQSPSPNKFPINMLITGLCGLRKWVSREVSGPGSAGYPGAVIFSPLGFQAVRLCKAPSYSWGCRV